jgi:WD repeat-containing protein 19
MDAYTAALGKEGSADEYKKVAHYYEGQSDFQRAGEFWFVCKEHSKALKYFLMCGERAVDQAIEVVGRARSDILTHTLIDFLMGETDGVPKDPNYIFRLYMALGNYPQAAKTAIIIARQEQELGNYRVAHQILLDTHRELVLQKIRVPQELAHNLMLLHSYVLVKVLVKLGDHLAGARMLVRVARNISKFPVHVVPILTSTVIECHRAGLRGLAFEHASTLVRPEYRSQLQEQYKRKIEAIVRKPGERNDAEEPETPSPYDPNANVAETVLECPSTRNTIPYCIATGRHIVLHDLALCPSCSFPASFSYFTKLVEAEGTCPMCMAQVPVSSITKMDEVDAKAWLKKHSADNKPDDKK